MSTLAVPLWIWAVTIAALALILGTELVFGIRRGGHPVGMREAALWTAAVVALAVIFGLALGRLGHPAARGQFFAGWLTEYSLSLDNLLIFVLLIGRSAVPRELHSRILLLGVALALVLRGIFIAAGASAISRFGWILYLFGALLIYTAARLVFSNRQQEDKPPGGLLLRAVRRFVPVSQRGDGARLLTRISGRRMATPVLFLIIAIAATDLMFALDSIPAIFGLTREPYLVFTANVFALLGLRQLYFLIGGLLSRLTYLSAGLAVILGFIGVKLITEALADSGVPAIGPVPVPHISTGLSLAIIGGVLVVVTVTSLLAPGRDAGPSRPADQPCAVSGPPEAQAEGS
ncbi:MAG TPA: TerC/Alx family metal homeostasis membrane protein [Streptosporangiaceae bacterium]|nr:TerC/Alx family metal homeostasis membrane protein [Streptosporangiaceae bacterium]